MKKYTRDEVEEKLGQAIFDQMDFGDLQNIIMEGYSGVYSMQDKELVEWFFATFEDEVEDIFVFESPKQIVVVERHTDGISWDGKRDDWEYV